MSIFICLIHILAQPEVPHGPSSIASQYAEIMDKYLRNVDEANGSRTSIARKTLDRDEALSQLVERSQQHETLSADDYIALFESCERLKRPDDSLHYARLAARDDESTNAQLSLVRALCMLGRVDEAGGVIANAKQSVLDDPNFYVLHHVVALKYEGLQRHDLAFLHMEKVVELVSRQVGTSSFFGIHLIRGLDKLAELSKLLGRTDDVHSKQLDCVRSLRSTITKVRATQAEGMPWSGQDIVRLGLHYQTLLRLQDRIDNQESENIIVDWIATLEQCLNASGPTETWLQEFTSGINLVSKRVTGEVASREVLALLNHIAVALRRATAVNDAARPEINRAELRLSLAKGILEQHGRLHKMIGSKLFTAQDWEELNLCDDQGPLLVHFFNPFIRNASTALNGFRALQTTNGVDKIRVLILVPQMGLTWESRTRKLRRATPRSLEEEKASLADYARVARISDDIRVLSEESGTLERLAIKYYPVSIVLDNDGRVTAVVTGHEAEKLGKLTQAVATTKIRRE